MPTLPIWNDCTTSSDSSILRGCQLASARFFYYMNFMLRFYVKRCGLHRSASITGAWIILTYFWFIVRLRMRHRLRGGKLHSARTCSAIRHNFARFVVPSHAPRRAAHDQPSYFCALIHAPGCLAPHAPIIRSWPSKTKQFFNSCSRACRGARGTAARSTRTTSSRSVCERDACVMPAGGVHVLQVRLRAVPEQHQVQALLALGLRRDSLNIQRI